MAFDREFEKLTLLLEASEELLRESCRILSEMRNGIY